MRTGTTITWDLTDVEEALKACEFACVSAAVNEDRPEEQRENLDKACGHLARALARVQQALEKGTP